MDEKAPPSGEPGPRPGEPAAGVDPGVPPDDEMAAVAEEQREVEAAAARGPGPAPRPRKGDGGDRVFFLGVLVLAVMLVSIWIGGTALWALRQDLAAATSRLDRLESRLEGEALARNLAGVRRARAELSALAETLPPELRPRLSPAAAALESLEQELLPPE